MKGSGRILIALLVVASIPLARTPAAAAGCDSAGQPATTVYLPNVTKTLGGPAGWVTPFYIQNAGAIQATLETSFFRFAGGALVTCRKTTGLAPGATLADNPNADPDLPDDTQFSVVVKSFGAPVVAIVNQLQGSGATQQALSYSGFTQGDTTVYVPNVTRRFFGYDVPLIVQDLGTATANVTARFISFDGKQSYTRTLSLGPGRASAIDPDFEPAFTGAANSGLVDGTQYAVTLTSDQPIAVVANAHNEAGAPVAFSHNGIARGATTLFAPYAAKGAAPGNTFSPIVVQNLGTAPADAQLTFASGTVGIAPQTFTLKAIPAGGAQAFDPRFTLGTTTECATASATCLGPGEYSLRITSTNPIGAVVLPNSATTAAGYLAATSLQPRALIPVAFRRIGGAAGWNTRILVYTGVAATLTLRAYAIPSGDLKATVPLSVGAVGWLSTDLLAVAGLADDAQYSVTIDGTTPLTAIAFEQASTGGDASMIFEAFGGAPLSAIPAPGSIVLTPSAPTVVTGGTQQFTAAVRDQFGAALAGAFVAWSLNPPTLGSVSGAGLFTAGQVAGTGTITAAAGSATASVPLTIALPQTQTVGGISFAVQSVTGADVFMESTMTAVDRGAVANEVPLDVAAVQTDFARTYTIRPKIYVFQTTSTFTTGLQSILGFTQSEAASVGATAIGVWYNNGTTQNIAVDWQKQSVALPISAIRHELTHWMEHQITSGPIPAWFDEGNARSEEFAVTNGQYRINQNKYGAASMAATNTLFTLADMTDISVWNARPGLGGVTQYYAASQAVQFLRQDLGLAGVVRMLDLMAQGMAFETAYQTVSGLPFSSFASSYAQRVRLLSQSYPAIVTSPDTSRGPGLTILMYGFTPGSQVTLSVNGSASSVPSSRTINAYGMSSTFLDSSWPTGNYTISVTYSGGTVTVNAAKTSSILASMLDVGDIGPLETTDDAPAARDWISSGRR